MEFDKMLFDFVKEETNTTEDIINVIKDYQCERLLQNYIKELAPKEYLLIESINMKQYLTGKIYLDEVKLLACRFAKSNLPLIHLKGISLLNDIYCLNDYYKRKMNDIDVLIKYDNMAESLDLLGEMGYIVESTNTKVSSKIMDLYLTDVESRGIHFPEFIKFVERSNGKFKIKMDCHISIMHLLENKDLRMSELFERSENQTLEDVNISVLEIHDRLLHLVLHFTKENFRCDTRWYLTGERRHSRDYRIRLPLLHEIVLLIKKYENCISWDILINRADELYCHDELKLVLQMVNRIYQNIVAPEIIEKIEINDANMYLKEKYMGMFFSLLLKDESVDFLLKSKLSEKAEVIIKRSYSADKLKLHRNYYIKTIPYSTGVEGHEITTDNSFDTLGVIQFSTTKDYFEFQIVSKLILEKCRGLFFTIGSKKRSRIMNAYINKYYIDLTTNNYSSLECCILNGYTELKLKHQVQVNTDKNEIKVSLPWCLVEDDREIESILFDIGIPELSDVYSMLPIQKYKLNDISKKGLGNVFHCSPLLLSTIQLD